MTTQDANIIAGAIRAAGQSVAEATARISFGDAHAPAGLEGLTMALSGDDVHGRRSLAAVVERGLTQIAEAQREGLREIAEAIRSHKN